MPSKQFDVDGIGMITIRKNRSSRHIKLSVDHHGKPRVSMPIWLPYSVGLDFALSKKDWLQETIQNTPVFDKQDGMGVGKAHKLTFVASTGAQIRTRIKQGIIYVYLPEGMAAQDQAAQLAAEKACQRALKNEAEHLLPQRVAEIAHQSGFDYKSISIKRLKGRWGSCNAKKELVFNSYLMQIPWDLIDYVIVHELAHTKVLSHSPEFWAELNRVMPSSNQKKKQLKQYQPVLMPTRQLNAA